MVGVIVSGALLSCGWFDLLLLLVCSGWVLGFVLFGVYVLVGCCFVFWVGGGFVCGLVFNCLYAFVSLLRCCSFWVCWVLGAMVCVFLGWVVLGGWFWVWDLVCYVGLMQYVGCLIRCRLGCLWFGVCWWVLLLVECWLGFWWCLCVSLGFGVLLWVLMC